MIDIPEAYISVKRDLVSNGKETHASLESSLVFCFYLDQSLRYQVVPRRLLPAPYHLYIIVTLMPQLGKCPPPPLYWAVYHIRRYTT